MLWCLIRQRRHWYLTYSLQIPEPLLTVGHKLRPGLWCLLFIFCFGLVSCTRKQIMRPLVSVLIYSIEVSFESSFFHYLFLSVFIVIYAVIEHVVPIIIYFLALKLFTFVQRLLEEMPLKAILLFFDWGLVALAFQIELIYQLERLLLILTFIEAVVGSSMQDWLTLCVELLVQTRIRCLFQACIQIADTWWLEKWGSVLLGVINDDCYVISSHVLRQRALVIKTYLACSETQIDLTVPDLIQVSQTHLLSWVVPDTFQVILVLLLSLFSLEFLFVVDLFLFYQFSHKVPLLVEMEGNRVLSKSFDFDVHIQIVI